ncbi:alpha/beta hydrolase domain-containing protein [Caballeronia terrestris]|jgi:acetyl esterase/lipase|uniref:Alpha/beta hydrolase domain-containing protein n=1 Tax=Caballeronia terrestris TaxID=1226301 RepID=A0A158KRT7_9BURK|nr:alpha/beta hydrolase [Caballeronia terrestris]SAL83848.1 alpha/beta hydrolase domain-containing protein [Caballeronia terrestris]
MDKKVTEALKNWADSLAGLGPVLRGEDRSTPMSAIRHAYTEMLAKHPAPEGVRFESTDLGGVPTTLVIPEKLTTDAIVFYIHGGAYIVGEPAGYHGIGGNYAKMMGAKVYMPNYRLAPEYPFPTPIEDTLSAYEALIDQGIPSKRIVFAGESAGGAMVVSIMVAARNAGLPLPAGGTAISPWANLEHTGISMTNREGLDPLNTKASLDMLARSFLGNALPNHPLASPVFADVTGLPPIQVQIGENELMLSDAMRLATHLADSRVRVDLEVWPEMFHAWHLYAAILPEARVALQSSVRFLESQLNAGR